MVPTDNNNKNHRQRRGGFVSQSTRSTQTFSLGRNDRRCDLPMLKIKLLDVV